jgi:hypothetical protein
MKMFLFAAAAATTIVVAPTLGQSQGAGPPPEAFPPYGPDTSSPYSSYGQLGHDYSDDDNCRVIRDYEVSPSDGRAIPRAYLDCD